MRRQVCECVTQTEDAYTFHFHSYLAYPGRGHQRTPTESNANEPDVLSHDTRMSSRLSPSIIVTSAANVKRRGAYTQKHCNTTNQRRPFELVWFAQSNNNNILDQIEYIL